MTIRIQYWRTSGATVSPVELILASGCGAGELTEDWCMVLTEWVVHKTGYGLGRGNSPGWMRPAVSSAKTSLCRGKPKNKLFFIVDLT